MHKPKKDTIFKPKKSENLLKESKFLKFTIYIINYSSKITLPTLNKLE